MKTVAFTTLGCRVNQYDTDAMKGLFLQNNYEAVDFDEKADIYVINTCSVTNMGEKKSRQLIRKAKRQNEDAYVIVTGCYAQLDPDAIYHSARLAVWSRPIGHPADARRGYFRPYRTPR